jgi:hypothetical protein
MRRYFFDLCVGNEVGEDDEGVLLPNLETVQREALKAIADMARDLIGFPATLAVEVRDEAGPVLRAKVVFEIDRTN